MTNMPTCIEFTATIDPDELKELMRTSNNSSGDRMILTAAKDGYQVAIFANRLAASIFQGALSTKGAEPRQLSEAEVEQLGRRLVAANQGGGGPRQRAWTGDSRVDRAMSDFLVDLFTPKSGPFGGSNFTTRKTSPPGRTRLLPRH